MRAGPIALAVLVLASGCLGLGADDEPAACPDPILATFHPGSIGSAAPRATGEPAPILTWARNPTNATAEIATTTLPEPTGLWDPRQPDARPDRPVVHEVAPGNRSFAGVVAEDPTVNESVRIRVDLGTEAPVAPGNRTCELTGVANADVALAEPTEPDQRAETGKGVLVHTVGWWTNGTSFYTNLDRYHERDDLPRSYGDDYGGGDPLKVYVYENSSDEIPPRYEREGYVTTIPGFNEALKDLPTLGARLAYLPPEDAYTREDRSDHPLYGDALIFYIEAVEVREVPCEVPEPVCDVPRTPEPPPAARVPIGAPVLPAATHR